MASEITDERSIQTRIADDLRARIEVGEYAAGDQLPTYEQLTRRYLCSSGVARKAIDLLRQQGLVISKQGKGVFVRERVQPKRHGIDRYARSKWKHGGTAIHDAEAGSQGLSVQQLYRELGEVPAPPAIATAFGIDEGGPVWVRKRTTVVDGRPHQLADSYYPLDLALGTRLTEEKSGPGGGFARLDEAGDPLAEISEEWSARMPTSPESVSLQLPGGTPVMDLTRIVYDTKGRAVEVMLAVIAADTVRMFYRFPIPD
ncbi:GntR family transcriptional regulator [Sphaerisporangium sp. NPDC049002]|uniref:GntR family transcriptional regulator n=1 Tax=unclassified Sphaerisporangium TaxID=2630420 RepID=UPI0033D4961A